MTIKSHAKDIWDRTKRQAISRRPPGVVDDPLPQRIEVFVRRRLLHFKRLWLQFRSASAHAGTVPERPIFILGCPRSGTTLLFRLLRRHELLGAPLGEGHILWNTYQHPRLRGWTSDRLTADDIHPDEPGRIYAGITKIAGRARFMDKTPRSSLRVPYLNELFPDAVFVLLKRNGPDTVSSLIEGWTLRHGMSYRLPEPLDLAEYKGRFWCYLLPPGWRDWSHSSIPEVAALQYVSSYETALADLAHIPKERILELRFEDLLARPEMEIARILEGLGLPPSKAVTAMASNLGAHPVQTTSPPRPDKWRDREDQIRPIMPLIAPTMAKLGYDTTLELL
ncbi:MAG: sulfotransferase [Actinobacteria bacterium]|nr:sulfotransferase [Actinomycetota bacterium]